MEIEALLTRAEALLDRLQAILPQPLSAPDWTQATAWRYRVRSGGRRALEPVRNPAAVSSDILQHIEKQKERVVQNTRQFVQGLPANNVLLTGARGTGKSSLVKSLLHDFAAQGLRLIEVDKSDLIDLPDIVDLLFERPEKFIIYCDDLSFEEGESGYKALKSILDGSVAGSAPNVLIYATGNRRHLLPETMKDNLGARLDDDGVLHPGEAIEEKISLSERFGLWVSFYPFAQEEYLHIVDRWLRQLGADDAQRRQAKSEALTWALERGSRSGRVARQFAYDFIGRQVQK